MFDLVIVWKRSECICRAVYVVYVTVNIRTLGLHVD